MADQTIHCVDCGQAFQFTDRDQAFYAEKAFTPPKRCRACRDIKKQSKLRQDQQRG